MIDKVLHDLVLTISPTSSLIICTTVLLVSFHFLTHHKALHTSCYLCADHSRTFRLQNGVNVYSSFRSQLKHCFPRDNFLGLYYILSHKTIATLTTYRCCNFIFIGGII